MTAMRAVRPIALLRTVALLCCALVIAGCGSTAGRALGIPGGLAPANLGQLTFKRQPAAEAVFVKNATGSLATTADVYTIQYGNIVAGSLQVALYRSDVDPHDPQVLDGIGRTIGEGTFEERQIHGQTVEVMRLVEQTIYLWFPPHAHVHCLLIVSKQFKAADPLMRAVIEYQQGRVPVPVPVPTPVVLAPGATLPPGAVVVSPPPTVAPASPSP